jgi:hypothetical protein
MCLGLSLLLTACGHHDQPQVQSADERLRDALTGTWKQDNNIDGLMRLESNGTSFEQWNTTNRPMQVWAYEGTWTATGDVFIGMTSKSQSWGTTNRGPEGTTNRFRIITISEQHLVLADDGQTNSFTREQ